MRRFAVLVALGMMLTAPAAAGAQPQPIELRTSPQAEPTKDVKLTVAPGSTDAGARVFLTAPADVAGVTLTAQVPSRPATFTPLGGTADAAFDLQASPKLLPVDIKVTDPGDGDTGTLFASVGGELQEVATLTVEREPEEGLAIEGAVNGALAIPVKTSSLARTIRIVNDTDRPIGKLRLRISALTDPRGEPLPLKATVRGVAVEEASEFTVDANDALDVDLAAEGLDIAGEYTATLALRYGRSPRQPVALTVTRAAADVTVTVEDPDPVQLDTDPNGNGDVAFSVTIKETSGRAVTLGAPTITVSRKEGEGRRQAGFSGSTVRQDPPGPDATPAEDRESILVPGKGEAVAIVTVKGLDGPGEFTVKMRWPGVADDDVATGTAYLRVDWIWALIALLLVIAIATAARVAWQELRPKLEGRRRLALAADRFEAVIASNPPPSPDERAVVDAIRVRLKTAWAELDEGTDVSASRADVEGKLAMLTRWLQATIAARAMAQMPVNARTELRKVGDYLRAEGGDAATALEALEALGKAEDEIWRSPEIAAAIDALAAAFASWRTGPHPGALPAAATDVADKLAGAGENLDAGKLDEAEAALRTAYTAFVRAVAGDLEAAANGERPRGVETGAWEVARAQISQALGAIDTADTPEAAYEAYTTGYAAYLTALVEGLRTALADLQPKPAEHDEIAKALDTATRHLEQGNVAMAAAFQRAAAELMPAAAAEATRDLPQRGAGGGDAAFADSAPPAFAGAATTDPAVFTADAAAIGRTLLGIRIAVYTLVAVATALLGLSLLWYPDPAWGTTADWTALILWGLGLQASGTTIADVAGLSEKLGGAQAK